MTREIQDALGEFAKSKNFRTAGSVSVALAVTHFAKEQGLPLDSTTLVTNSGTQVVRLTKALIQTILARYNITDILSNEAGRTSRGSVANMILFVQFLNTFAEHSEIDLDVVESFWVEQAKLIIDARESDTKNVSYSAVPLEQNGQRFFFTTIPVSSLFPFCYVASRNEDPKSGFQRNLNRNRAEDIAKYLFDGLGSIPTNIVLSAQPEANLEYNTRSKILKYQLTSGSFLVLDGQHRLWGYEICREKYGKDLRIPVSVYIGLTRAEEAKLFIDINTTQVGVPSALLLDIKQVAEIESTSEQILRGLFDELNNDIESPLRKLLSPAKSVSGKISRVSFNKSMLPVIRSNAWVNASRKIQYQLFLNFLRALHQLIDDKSVFIRAAFFESICEIFDDVIQTSIAKHSDAKVSSIKDILLPLASVDFERIAERTRPTKSAYLEVIKSTLKKSVSISDSMV
ncbi:DUF4928 family protein [Undibacterium sp. CY18W]|uniref:DUF4928 family protein n=1 Tax=Undibacterium hunanense TaxID=2762292 RepID=A0ABR6ZLJ8_9BURK|nr:DUF4928 family protein [Undibacterium hunanense]MBC3916760.1 DUF4928 family protein [Undibacterium hunanense]